MSTRCNVIVKDGSEELIFYRHSDGYPEGALPTLQKFLELVKSGAIRDNLSQASGWLILIGAVEYQTIAPDLFPQAHKKSFDKDAEAVDKALASFKPAGDAGYGWKCGAYEPTTGIHGDIEYLYVVDLETKTIHIDGKDGFEYAGKYKD